MSGSGVGIGRRQGPDVGGGSKGTEREKKKNKKGNQRGECYKKVSPCSASVAR